MIPLFLYSSQWSRQGKYNNIIYRFKDQRLVKSVIKLLNSLRSDIVGSKLSLVNSFELDSNTNNDLLEQLNARVAEVEEII